MLRQRIITAIIMIPVILWVILALDGSSFALVSGLIMIGVGGYEWSRLSGFTQPRQRALFTALLIACAFAAFHLSDYVFPVIMSTALVWWVIALAMMAVYDPEKAFFRTHRWIFPVSSLVVLLAGWWYLTKLHEMSPWWVIYIIGLVAVADIGAYFSGRRFGKHKLASKISPGKTLEGVWGAFAATLAVSILGIMLIKIPISYSVYFVFLSLITVIISIAGDLYISMMKREAGVKDSGHILPGHGGILDRIDSHLAALPVFTTGLAWAGLNGLIA